MSYTKVEVKITINRYVHRVVLVGKGNGKLGILI